VNVCFRFLDTAVIEGRADELACDDLKFATLLEQVASLAGALRHLGVESNTRVPVLVDDDLDAVVASLAVARLGGVITDDPDHEGPIAICSVERRTNTTVRMSRGATEPDVDWTMMLRAGRSDPAAVELVVDEARFSLAHTVAEMNALLDALSTPLTAAELRAVLGV
jgi:non-ribosomal peptide synthetase component F